MYKTQGRNFQQLEIGLLLQKKFVPGRNDFFQMEKLLEKLQVGKLLIIKH